MEARGARRSAAAGQFVSGGARQRPNRGGLWIGGAALLLVVNTTSCRPGNDGKGSASAARGRNEPLEAKAVQTAVAETRPMERAIVVSGSFHAREQSTLSVKVAGRLEKIAVDVGSVVKRGDELAQVERADYELRVKQAEAVLGQARALVGLPLEGSDDSVDIDKAPSIRQARALLEEARANLDRTRQLAADKIAPQSELDTVEAAHAVAQTRYQNALEDLRGRAAAVIQRRAELNIARKQLSDSTTRAPFNGVVHERLASLGEYVQTGTPLLVMAEVDPLRLRLEVPERESPHVRAGQPIRISVSGSTNRYAAEIRRVSPILTEASRMLLVEADVQSSPALRPGLFAQAEIIVSGNDPAVCVPAAAVTSFVGIEKVFLVRDGKALERNVVTGRRDGNQVEIVTGIANGDTVVLNPGRLRSDQPVVLDRQPPGSGTGKTAATTAGRKHAQAASGIKEANAAAR